MELTLEGPASKPVRTVARNVEHTEERIGDRIIHHVRFRHESPQPKLADLAPFDSAPRFEVSSFADYAAFAAPLNARNAPMAVPSAALRKLAAGIVGDAATTAAKVERLHNWVAENIRYVGIGFEDGGFVSQPADAIVAVRYGDCKAHATLLKALLATQDIEANLVVVNMASEYTLTELPTPDFDHAIVYVPELDTYLDPTAPTLAFGALPPRLSGKPVLNIDKGTLGRIPVASPDRYMLGYDTEYELAADGVRQGRVVLSGRGPGAAIGRYFAEHLDGKDRKHAAAEMIEQAHLQGSGDLAFADPRMLSNEYAVTASFELDKFETGKSFLLNIAAVPDPRPPLLALTVGVTQDQPIQCRSLEYRQTVALVLPPELHVSDKPAPVAYTADFTGTTPYGEAKGHVEVTGEAVIDGRTVRTKARLQVKFDAPVCPASFVNEIRKGVTRFEEMQRGTIGLTPKQVSFVNEVSSDYNAGVKAYQSRDYALAITTLKPLAEKGHARAEQYLGWLYEGGLGVTVDHREAARWYRLAAEQGDSFSQVRLGYMYEKGLGVARDDVLAAQWYGKAAEAGNQQGQSWLGTMYRDGRGVPRNFKEAEKWFTLAADQGSAWALMTIGILYTHGGDGLPQDYEKAIGLFRKAAEQGDADAFYNLGWAYENGLGVARDRQQAIEWYSKAAGRNHALALGSLDRLSEHASASFWSALLRVVGL
jgi:TPR repeat protein